MGRKESCENITVTTWPAGEVDIKISRILLQLSSDVTSYWDLQKHFENMDNITDIGFQYGHGVCLIFYLTK